MTARLINLQDLERLVNEKNWNQLLVDVKPKHFIGQKELPGASCLAQICRILVDETTPDAIKVLCLKCLGNSCLGSYEHKSLENSESDEYSEKLYSDLAENEHEKDCSYTHNPYFCYDGVVKWTVDHIVSCDKSTDCSTGNKLDMFRLGIQFLCNFFTYAHPNAISVNDEALRCLDRDSLKQTILDATSSSHRPLANAACIYVHNALKNLHYDYFMSNWEILCQKLLKSAKEGFTSATDALLHLLSRPNVFENIYSGIDMNEKLDLLGIIDDELWEASKSNRDAIFTKDQAEFLAFTFCKRSDLILKTVDTYVNSVEPREVILILEILGLFTSMKYKISTNAKRLLINCKYLLMSLHMMGKDSDNHFTPITNLSKLASNYQERAFDANSTSDAETTTAKCDLQDHPAFGFKARLIQVIANLVYKDKTCQDLFREMDGIPLLLDCCNIDARNPLIPQWTIFALRNLCEGNLANQEIIGNCKKEEGGVLDNPVLREMGLTLHEDEDGKSIRIASLRRE